MNNGLTHYSQVITNCELVGIGMFGVSVQGRRAAVQQAHRVIKACTQLPVCLRDTGAVALTTTQVPLGSRVEMWELRISPVRLNTTALATAQKRRRQCEISIETLLQPGQ